MNQNITGHTCSTKNSLLLNAGAFFKNYIVGEDTYETAMRAGKCLGATQGGGSFEATPTMRDIEIDGADPEPVIDGWKVLLKANIIEITPDTLKLSLGTGVIQSKSENYYEVRARRNIVGSDWIDNITWIGSLSGSHDPVIIQLYNSMNTTGLSITAAPKSQAVIAVTFTAKSDPCKRSEDRDFAPFSIFYPKALPPIEFDKVFDKDVVITGKGTTGATVTVTGGTIQPETTGMVENGEFSISIPKQISGVCITGFQELKGRRSLDAIVYVETEPQIPSDDEEDY